MIKTGDFNRLAVVRKVDFGYYLNESSNDEDEALSDILLPIKSALGIELNIGDEVEAFIYRDSSDRLIATLRKPLAKVGELAYLKVVSTTSIGSFIDFGLEKDILVPFREKLYTLDDDKCYLFYIYIDKTGRIAATTDVDKYMKTADRYKIGDTVKGTVYGIQTNKNVQVAVDNEYRGVILHNEYFDKIRHGEVLELKVVKIYDGGKLGLTVRKSSREEVSNLQNVVLEYLKVHNGFMSFNDKSDPEKIYKEFHVSKSHFKQALGGLMKKGLIVQDEKGTRLS